MKGRAFAFETSERFRRAALVVDGRLEALEIDRLSDAGLRVGAVREARVREVLPALQAAILDLGTEDGFLANAKGIRAGQRMTVQVRREAEHDKAARVSPDIQVAGQFVVFTPGAPGINASRKMDPDLAERLTGLLTDLSGEGGFVLRTRAADAPEAAIRADAEALIASYREARVDGPDAFARALLHWQQGDGAMGDPAFVEGAGAHSFVPRVTRDDAPFETLDLDARIEGLLSPRAELNEGWMAVEQTAALVAVDVNTGSAKGGDAAKRVNLDAIKAIPRELALRGLGGTIMIDCAASPKKASDRKYLADALKGASRRLDQAHVLGWGPAGLLEMRCRRPARSLAQLLRG